MEKVNKRRSENLERFSITKQNRNGVNTGAVVNQDTNKLKTEMRASKLGRSLDVSHNGLGHLFQI